MREMKADRYYGSTARDYDMKRSTRPDWEREQVSVEKFVTQGPVLDVPVGTGRYLQIYTDKGLQFEGLDASDEMIAQAKMKHPDLKAERGTITNLPYRNRQFGTVVCSRLLNWLYPVDMAKAVQEIRRVGREIVTSIRLGDPGLHEHQANYTHSHEDFYSAIDGMLIAGKDWVLTAPDGDFCMYHLRKPTWSDVHAQFLYHKDGYGAVQRLSNDWFDIMGMEQLDVSKGSIRAEQWGGDRIRSLIESMARKERPDGKANQMITNDRPYSESGNIVIVRSKGGEFMIDGRRRSNIWMKQDGYYQVLVIDVS